MIIIIFFITSPAHSIWVLYFIQNVEDELLIFSDSDWASLKTRIEELKAERTTQKEKFKEDRQDYLSLQEDCKKFRSQIQVLEQKCQVTMTILSIELRPI